MKRKTKPVKTADIGQLYEARGYRILERSDLRHRFLSFLIDTSVMLAPIMIWDIIMMAVLGSIVSIAGILIVNIIIGVLLLGTILGVNAYIYIQTGGQSLGMRSFQFKVIKANGKDAPKNKLIMREVIGFDIPFIVLMIFLNIIGVIIYWTINALVMLVDKRQRTLVDMIMGTCVIGVEQQRQVQRTQPDSRPKEAPQHQNMPRKSRLDLHIHSNFSVNGDLNVEEIFQYAARNNLKTISITDLDCAKSNGIAVRMSKLYHVNYVPGIEINCNLHGARIRVLGYFIQYNSELFSTIENDSLVNEKKASIERVRRFERLLGKKIDIDRLLMNNRFQKIPGELIAKHVLNRAEYMECELLQPYINGSDMEHAYRQLARDFFAHGKPCYVAVKYPLLEDVLDVITLTGGIPVLAYPGKLMSHEAELMDEAVRMGIQGIEVFHPSHTRKEMSELMRYAMQHKLFITGGSGFYYEQSGVHIGEFNCPEDAERIIQDFIDANM